MAQKLDRSYFGTGNRKVTTGTNKRDTSGAAKAVQKLDRSHFNKPKSALISGASPAKTTVPQTNNTNTDAWTRATASQTKIPPKAENGKSSGKKSFFEIATQNRALGRVAENAPSRQISYAGQLGQVSRNAAAPNSQYDSKRLKDAEQQHITRTRLTAEIEKQLEAQKEAENQALLDSGGYREATLKDLLINSAKQGYYNSRYGEESYKSMNGRETDKQKFADILAGEDYKFVPQGKLAEAVSGAAALAGQQYYQMTNPAALAAGATAAAGAFIAGNAGPQALIPEEVATVPSAFVTGLKIASAEKNYEIEAGLAYNEMLENGVSEKTARNIAAIVGGANAGLEALQLDELFKSVKILNNNPLTGSASKRLVQYLVDKGLALGNETLQEVLQEGSTIAGTQAANKIDKGEWAYSSDEVLDRLKDTAVSSALSFGIAGLPSTVIDSANIYRNGNRIAQNAQQVIQQNTQPTAQQGAQERTDVQDGTRTAPAQTNAQTQQEAAQRTIQEAVQRQTVSNPVSMEEQVLRQREAAVQKTFTGIADKLGDSGRKAFQAAYQGTDRGDYTGEFLRAYHAGMTNQKNPNSTSAVSFAAYSAGKNDAAASLAREKRAAQFAKTAGTDSGLVFDDYVSREMDSAVADEVNTVSKALGVRTRMVDQVLGGLANGDITGSDVLIAKDAVDPALQVVGHEWTHRVQELAPEQYRAFRDAVTSMPDVQEAANILLDQYNRAGVETSYEQALDEATANYAGEMIANSDVLDDFIRKHSADRTLLQKLRDAIHEIVGKLTGRAKRQAQTVEGKLQAAFEAASRQAKTLQAEGSNDTMGATRYSAKGKYWRPDLSQNEWTLLNRHMEQEISDSAHTLDEATQWAYAEEKGNRVFAIYGIGDGTEATPLYASGGKTAMADYQAFMDAGKRFNYGTDGGAESLNRLFKTLRRKQGQSNGSISAAERGKSANGHDRVSAVQGDGNGRRSTGTGPENRGVNTKFSLKEYSDQEKRDHRKEAIAYFGKTYNWNETGYLTPAGTKLDFSGRHEGGPGGYRTVDHRDIRDAIGEDYGGDDYSGSMVQFMSEGNIRISPESGGINLSVEPTKSQMDALADFVGKNRGEVILDLDTPDGQTVSSTEYPRGTHSSKILNDIKAYFKDGTTPYVSEVSQFLSLKGTENAQEIAALKRENENLKERVEYWKSQTRRTQQATTDKMSVAKAADALVKDYGASIKGSEIASDLQSLYDYIAGGKDGKDELTYTEARRRSDAIAEKIAESAVEVDDRAYKEYAGLRKYLKDTKLTLTAQDAAEITDFNELRKSQFGKVKLGTGEHTNVDQIYSELAEQYPEFFSEQRDMNISDQVQRIADVANRLYKVTEYNPFEGYMGQAVASISNDIMDRFFDLPQTKKTFADRQAEQLQATRAAGKQAAQDAFLAGQMAQGRQDAKRLRSTAQALAKERTRRAEQVQALKERYREKDVTRRDNQKRRELRAKITRHASALSQKLLRPTDNQHIPEDMRSAVAKVLESINQESNPNARSFTLDPVTKERIYKEPGTPTNRTVAFQNLKEQYQKIAQDGDTVVDPSLLGGDDVAGGFSEVIKMGDTRLADLTTEQLKTMWNVLKSVEHSVTTAGKTLASEKFATTKQFADALRMDGMTRRRKLGNNVAISLETPYTFFAHFGQTGKDIYRMLRNAQDHQEIMARDVAEKVHQILGDAKTGIRKNAVTPMNEEVHHFTTTEGRELDLTTAQAMELYLLSERKQAEDHLLKGGIVQPEIKIPGKTKIPRGTDVIHLSAEDIQSIVKALTPEQIRIADGLQKLTTGVLANYGNEASMKAYGYKKFTEKDYWPIKSTKEALHSTTEKSSGNTRSIKNIGMAQAVKPNASTTLEVRSVFDTFADHASDMIDYAAWLCPMEDVNRLYNFQFRDSEGNLIQTVKGYLEEKGGQGSQQYWQKLMGDIQNGIKVKDFEPLTDKFAKGVGSFKGAAVGANVRVVIQQPTAFFRASVVLNPADMAKGIAGGVTKGNGWEKAVRYSPIAMRKDVGSFDISSPYTLNDRFYGKEGVINKVNEAAGTPAGAADAITWGALWNACEWQVKRENPGLRAGSNEFYSAVNEVFTDMIDQTQVVDGILQRSNIMRGKSDLAKQATSFMGEPIMSLNVFMRAWDNMRYEENPAKRSKAIKSVGRAAAALLVTNVVNAMAQSLADAGRDDDEDKDYWEKYMTALTGITGDEKTMKEILANVLLEGNLGSNNNPVGNIPFLKDILSLAQGYSVSRTDMQVFSDIVSASKTFMDSIGGNGKKSRSEAMAGMFAACAKLFGLPAANIKRDVTATINTIMQATGNVALQYEWDKLTYNISSTANKNRYLGLMFKALEQGDLTTYEHIRKELKDYMAVDSTTADNSMRTRLEDKQEADEDYRLPKESAALIGAKTRYDNSESEDKFDENDLSSDDYIVYSRKKAETYSSMEAGLTGSTAFQKFSSNQKDKALSSLETYAKKTTLQSVAGSDYEITDKWILKAQEAEKKYRIKPEVYIALKTQVSDLKSVKDRNGETIPNSKGLLIMQAIYNTPGLSEAQRNALFEYLGVGKSIRHYNKALVNEKVRKNARLAGK